MKNWARIFLLNMMIILSHNGLGQDHMLEDNGIYLNLNDFLNKQLTYPFPSKKDGYKLKQPKLHFIKIHTPEQTIQIDLRTIWGYRENGNDWILRNGQLYELINHEGIWVYKQTVINDGGFKDLFYFSQDGQSELFWLDYKNLKSVYHQDSAFLKALEDVKWFQSIDFYNLKNHKLEIVNIYQSAHKN